MEKMATVKHLTLMLNKVTSRGAEVLAASLPLSSLLSLTLYATQIDLHDLCVGDEGARHFASSLPHTRHLTSFGLTQSGVTPTGLGYLLRGLEQNSKITSLNLHSNFIDGTGAADVANSHLKQLILNENHYIGDEGARELAVALSHNASLEVLSLKSCGIGRRGAERFAGPLETNSTLRVLNLCGNGDIGDDGIEMIARGLRDNSGLEQLDLSSCGVSDEGCDHLADALGTTGTTLTHITLHRNTISDGGAISLAHTLTKNRLTLFQPCKTRIIVLLCACVSHLICCVHYNYKAWWSGYTLQIGILLLWVLIVPQIKGYLIDSTCVSAVVWWYWCYQRTQWERRE